MKINLVNRVLPDSAPEVTDRGVEMEAQEFVVDQIRYYSGTV